MTSHRCSFRCLPSSALCQRLRHPCWRRRPCMSPGSIQTPPRLCRPESGGSNQVTNLKWKVRTLAFPPETSNPSWLLPKWLSMHFMEYSGFSDYDLDQPPFFAFLEAARPKLLKHVVDKSGDLSFGRKFTVYTSLSLWSKLGISVMTASFAGTFYTLKASKNPHYSFVCHLPTCLARS